MPIQRFSNQEEIIKTRGKVRGLTWRSEDIPLLQLGTKNISPSEKPIVEVHVYAPGEGGKYLNGGVINDENFDISKDELFIDWSTAFRETFDIERGLFEVGINVHKNILGSDDSPPLFIQSISPDRRELHIKVVPGYNLDLDSYLDAFGEESRLETIYETVLDNNGNEILVYDDNGNPTPKATVERPLSDDISLNFGGNMIYRIINQKDWNEENDFVVRLYQPLAPSIKVKDLFWIVEELSDTYFDNINIKGPQAIDINKKKLRGPNLNANAQYGTITETDFRNWNQLLDANASVSQQIVDNIFSGSLEGEKLGIDYTGLDNFVHFSSARDRVDNFYYKLQRVEFFDDRLKILEDATGTDSTALQGNIAQTTKQKDQVIGSFDGFERWLYNERTASLSTHGVSGSFVGAQGYTLRPWPKFLTSGVSTNHHSTSSLGLAWIDGFRDTASLYDVHNESSLAKTIPEHIRLDNNNSQYELFVNMVGQHYDILYSYINNLTKIYYPEEQPKLGQSKDVMYQATEALGWRLINGKQGTSLWQYKLGVDSGSGAYLQTGSLFSKTDEEITTEVWRRIFNNLPYLLKTKGTTRGIKALMNTYGIPQTLLSIREYGGPKVGEEAPTLIEDRFTYALQFASSSTTHVPINNVTSSLYPSGSYVVYQDGQYSSSLTESISPTSGVERSWGIQRGQTPAMTREFRFKPAKKANMLLLSRYNPSGQASFHLALQHTASFSGSNQWGRVFFCLGQSGENDLPQVDNGDFGNSATDHKAPMTASTDYLPIFDGDFWNIRLYFEPTSSNIGGTGTADNKSYINRLVPFNDLYTDSNRKNFNAVNNSSVQYRVECQRASDYIKGKVVHSSSLIIVPESETHNEAWAPDFTADPGDGDGDSHIYIGGNNRGILRNFSVLGGATPWNNLAGTQGVGQYTFHFFNGTLTGSGPTDYNEFSLSSSFARPGIGMFTGSMQEYREWLEVFDKRTFDLHTLNPTSYVSGLSPTSSYDTLIRHYPFGTDLYAVDHNETKYMHLTSSHPAQTFRDFSIDLALSSSDTNVSTTFATASGFPAPFNLQRGHYTPVEETYFVQGVSLGGSLPKSQKIRLEDNKLIRRLSPQSRAERSSFDLAPVDTNKLGLFYSAADQINKEIFNHIGDVELDDFVGDPNDEFETDYPNLLHFSKEYWKKYSDKNDINAFMRVFSQFDFSLFEQMKQLIPERVDEAMGLLVEPAALERSKVRLTSLPVIEKPFYDGFIADPSPTMSGLIQPLSASIKQSPNVVASQVYHVSRSGYVDFGNYVGPIELFNASGAMDYTQIAEYALDALPEGSSSVIANYVFPNPGANRSGWTNLHNRADEPNSLSPGGDDHVVNSIPLLSEQYPPGIEAAQSAQQHTTTIKVDGVGSILRPKSDFLRVQVNTYNEFDTIRDFKVNVRFAAQTGSTGQIPSSSRFSGRLIETEGNLHGQLKQFLTFFSFHDPEISGTPGLGSGSYYFRNAGGGTGITLGDVFGGTGTVPNDGMMSHGHAVMPVFYNEHAGSGAGPAEIVGNKQGSVYRANSDLPTNIEHTRGMSAAAKDLTAFDVRTFEFWKESTTGIGVVPNGDSIIAKNLRYPLHQEFEFKNVHIRPRTNLTFELFVDNPLMLIPGAGNKHTHEDGAGQLTASLDAVMVDFKMKKILHDPIFVQVLDQRPSPKFDKYDFTYNTGSAVSKVGKDRERFISQSIGGYPGLFQTRFSRPADYQDDQFIMTENLRYDGCKLVGPGINSVTEIAAIDNRPVIEVYGVNPNQLIYTDIPTNESRGGNLIVR